MIFLKKHIKTILIILLTIALVLSLGKCASDLKQHTIDLGNAEAKNHSLTQRIDKDGKTITQQKQIIATHQREINKLTTKVDGLTNISEQVKYITKTIYKNIEVPIDRPIYITVDGDKYLKIPAPFKDVTHEWYGFTGKIEDQGKLKLDSLYFISKPTLTFGLSKWEWKKPFTSRTPLVTHQDENPYVKVESMTNVKLQKLQRKFTFGGQVGYGMTLYGPSPYIGVGINYTFIRF